MGKAYSWVSIFSRSAVNETVEGCLDVVYDGVLLSGITFLSNLSRLIERFCISSITS